jgi:hypothetical protein
VAAVAVGGTGMARVAVSVKVPAAVAARFGQKVKAATVQPLFDTLVALVLVRVEADGGGYAA